MLQNERKNSRKIKSVYAHNVDIYMFIFDYVSDWEREGVHVFVSVSVCVRVYDRSGT